MTLLDDRPLAPSVPPLGPGLARLALAGRPASKEPLLTRLGRRVFSEAGLVVLVPLAAYFAVAMLLDFKYHTFDGDAISRMANGFYILHSRDPHLAAIGFVWNPLSSVADLPLLAFNSVWPALASHNVAGTTVSALAMAGSVHQLHSILREWKVAVIPRLIMTVLYAFNPMILLFGGNGMSEALYLFTMLATTRYLLRWLREGDLASLVYAAIALAFAYLERSEPVAAASMAAPLVCWITYARSHGQRRDRVWAGLTDVTIFLMPIVTAFVGWAVMAWVITGQPFQQFTSKYGNAALIANSHEVIGTMTSRLVHEVKAITYMGPLLMVIVVVALVVAARRRNVQILGIVAILGAGLGFTLLSYLTNAIFPWYRYYILVAPLQVLLVGSLFAVPSRVRAHEEAHSEAPETIDAPRGQNRRSTALGALGAAAVAVVLLIPSVPGTAAAMGRQDMAPDILLYTGFIFHHHLNAKDQQAKDAYSQVQTMAGYFDQRHLPNGDVVVDTANSCIPNVVTNSANPRMFVIHNDRDFQRVLADPLVFHAHYLLVAPAGQYSDAVADQYPNLGTATPWARLVHTFDFSTKGYCSGFSLYRVTGHPTRTY